MIAGGCPPPSVSAIARAHRRIRLLTSSLSLPLTSTTTLTPRFSSSMTSSSSSSPPHPHPLTSLPIDDSAHYPFGPSIQLPGSQLFFLTSLSLASVNLAPVVPGHALICPRRLVKRVQDMTPEELTDSSDAAPAGGGVRWGEAEGLL